MAVAQVSKLIQSEDVDRGRQARSDVPRESHADWSPAPDRPDPVAILRAQAESRDAALVPIRYGRMLTSPFAFYRGAAAVMAADLAHTPASGIVVQVCGDAHISNFGGFATPDRHLLFGLNDFDETLPGPWEWDLKRMAASIEIAGRDIQMQRSRRAQVVTEAIREYRVAMREFAELGTLETWYARLSADEVTARFGEGLGSRGRAQFVHTFAKGRRKTSARAVERLTEIVDGKPQFVSVPPLLEPLRNFIDLGEAGVEYVRSLFAEYVAGLYPERRHLVSAYSIVDIARKVVGVGSVGTRAWICLLVAADQQDALVLQCKQAQTSVLEPYLGRSEYDSHGERVVRGQRMMQAAPDLFLSWQRVSDLSGDERDYYIRQLWDWKASADLSRMNERGLLTYSRACAWSLARSHARSGDRKAIGAYLGKNTVFERAIAQFSATYADQNELDYQRLSEAAAAGEVPVQSGI